MDNVDSILVVVDPTVERDFVVDRVKSLIQHSRASVRFFINSANTLTQHSYAYEGMDGHFFEKQRLLFIEHYTKLLEDLVTEFTAEGIVATSAFSEEHHLAEAIIAQAREYAPDLVMKSTHHHNVLKRSIMSNTDWRLIRKCPCPLLLVKPREWNSEGSIVAAVDPIHTRTVQNKLDHLLVDTAENLSRQLQLSARVFHCYYPYVGTMFPTVMESSEQLEELRKRHQSKLDELLARHNIPVDNIEIVRGDLVPSMMHYLERSNANVLVIGALSRNAIERAIVGNTAEKILDDCPCDVLVIKP